MPVAPRQADSFAWPPTNAVGRLFRPGRGGKDVGQAGGMGEGKIGKVGRLVPAQIVMFGRRLEVGSSRHLMTTNPCISMSGSETVIGIGCGSSTSIPSSSRHSRRMASAGVSPGSMCPPTRSSSWGSDGVVGADVP